jgi:hypothetical protein
VHRHILCLLLISACAGSGRHQKQEPLPADCPPAAPAGSGPVESEKVESLAGRYRVTFVSLSYGPSYWRGHLDLEPTDTLRRYYVQTIRGYIKRGMRPLAGHFRSDGDSVRAPEDAEVEDGVLFLGCRYCMDGSPDRLRLVAQTPEKVWGIWENPETGFVQLTDSTGHAIPNPAGYFCLRRIQ